MKVVLMMVLIILFAYLILIKPRLLGRPDSTPLRGFFYAHRGLHNMNPDLRAAHDPYCNDGDFPENSYAAIKRAVEHGYGIEFDVHLTKDNIPVVFHDDSLKRICGVDANLRDFTYEELQTFSLMGTQEKIPAFTEILALVNGKVPLIIEYKVENGNASRLCSICNAILADYDGVYCIESFHPSAVRWYRTHRPDIIRGQLSEYFTLEKWTIPRFMLSHLIGNCYASPDFVAYNCKHRKELSRTLCRNLYHGLSVAWTVRSQKELEEISPYFDLYIFENFIPQKEMSPKNS